MQFSIEESFKKSVENFYSTSKILSDGLEARPLIALFEYIASTEGHDSKISHLEVHYKATINQVLFDFMKSVHHLCQGFFADHYLFLRRSIEYVQLFAFINSSENPRELFQEYLVTDTHSFKKKDFRFQNWIKKEKPDLNKNFPIMMSSYKLACDHASHAGLDHQTITQSWKNTDDGFLSTINFFDLENDQFEKSPFIPCMIQVFRVYIEILHASFMYKLTSKPWPEEMFNNLYDSFNKYFYSYRDHLIQNEPEYVEMIGLFSN